jgi:hypothetical protein
MVSPDQLTLMLLRKASHFQLWRQASVSLAKPGPFGKAKHKKGIFLNWFDNAKQRT